MDAHERSDAELLAGVAGGDDDAFAVFYRRHLDAVVAYFRRRVPEPELAFDLTAETFAAVVVAAGRFREDAPATAWLFAIARNKLLESLRRGRVQDSARLELALEQVGVDDADLERVERHADAGRGTLEQALAGLPEPTRRAIEARIVEERGYEDIARELECSQQVVRQRVRRGLARLRTAWEARS